MRAANVPGEDRLSEIKTAVMELDERRVLALVEEALAQGNGSLEVLDAAQEGMRGVGERYEQQEIFLSGLIMAGEIFRQVLERTQGFLEPGTANVWGGRVLLGTVQGDIHDIGKSMIVLALRSFGFTVLDLGVNIPPERFLSAARDFRPDIVGLSGLLTVAHNAMRDTVALLRSHADELGGAPLVVIGGGTLDEDVARFVGADMWTTDAMEGVRICQRLIEGRSAAQDPR